jgi:hypothetical protein
MTCLGTIRIRLRVNRGPRRIAPREEVAEARRRRSNGEKPDAIATSMRLSKRTIYRYLAEVEPAPARRIRAAVEGWPDAEQLTPALREELIAWLYDELAGWHA